MAEELPLLEIECALDAPNLKRVLKRADQQKIPFVAILGEEEEAAGAINAARYAFGRAGTTELARRFARK